MAGLVLVRRAVFITVFLGSVILAPVFGWCAKRPQWQTLGDRPGDRMLLDFFRVECLHLQSQCLANIDSKQAWDEARQLLRGQLLEMLGLNPLPKRTPLNAVVTGKLARDGIVVEKLYFESLPKLYVTANLYRPEKIEKPLPGILYVCGHGRVKIDGVSYGNKCHYQHHGVWFAKHGYVCLVIDSLQLGEIEGIHHGTYRYDMWWWNNRGYTPAGVEAWNCIRALDYLQSRPEVDPDRLGVTGRSGGGAYSWWIAAIDDRIKAAVPVAGITDLQNHVLDGCVEGHCDCMFIVNTYRWDYPAVAALVAPRPLLIGNTDDDDIFPQDGVLRLYEKVRRIYELCGKPENCQLAIFPGKHQDLPELQRVAFQWFDYHLKGLVREVEAPAPTLFTPQELKVFESLPEDQVNTTIQETFVPMALEPAVPEDMAQWGLLYKKLISQLKEKSFRAWPDAEPTNAKRILELQKDQVTFSIWQYRSQGPVVLRLYALSYPEGTPRRVVVQPVDEAQWMAIVAALRCAFDEQISQEARIDDQVQLPEPNPQAWAELKKQARDNCLVIAPPRGVGPFAFNPDKRKQVQIRRRFMLLGMTLDEMQIWDVCQAVRAVRSCPQLLRRPITIRAEGLPAGWAMYAALFEPVDKLELVNPPTTHRMGPYLLNVRRVLDLPQTLALVADKTSVELSTDDLEAWQWTKQLAEKLHWPDSRLSIHAR